MNFIPFNWSRLNKLNRIQLINFLKLYFIKFNKSKEISNNFIEWNISTTFIKLNLGPCIVLYHSSYTDLRFSETCEFIRRQTLLTSPDKIRNLQLHNDSLFAHMTWGMGASLWTRSHLCSNIGSSCSMRHFWEWMKRQKISSAPSSARGTRSPSTLGVFALSSTFNKYVFDLSTPSLRKVDNRRKKRIW